MIGTILIIIGIIIALIGIIGCIIPAVPGPPLNFLALVILELGIYTGYSTEFYLFWAAVTLLVTVLDYALPIMGAKVYKASGFGIWGSVIGMIIGIIFFPPFGMIIGLFFGAVIGELLAGKEEWQALKVGSATFLASMFMILIKLAASGVMTYYFVKASVEYIF